MRHQHTGGPARRFHTSDDMADRRHTGRHRRHHGGRPFDYGELRLLTLAMISEQPSHGYELMKGIEERMGGSYTPSPGVMYPTLAWLEDSGYAAVETAEGGRKRYQATDEGRAFLAANRTTLEDLTARIQPGGGRYDGVPAPILRGMENLKLALRLRIKRGPLDQQAGEAIAAALDAAALAVERS